MLFEFFLLLSLFGLLLVCSVCFLEWSRCCSCFVFFGLFCLCLFWFICVCFFLFLMKITVLPAILVFWFRKEVNLCFSFQFLALVVFVFVLFVF